MNQRNVALQNLPDRFKNVNTTRVTRTKGPEGKEADMDEEEYMAEYIRLETLKERGGGGGEEKTMEEDMEESEECKIEFRRFLDNMEHKEQMNLRPEWAEERCDMYPQFKVQKDNYNEQMDAPKIYSDGCDVNGMEELRSTQKSSSIVLDLGLPGCNKDVIATWG